MCPEPDADTNAQALPDKDADTETLSVVHADVCLACHDDARHPNGYCHVTFVDGYTIVQSDADRRADYAAYRAKRDTVSNFYRDTTDTTPDFQPDQSADATADSYDPADDGKFADRIRFTASHGHAGGYAAPVTFIAWTDESADFQCTECGQRFSIEWLGYR